MRIQRTDVLSISDLGPSGAVGAAEALLPAQVQVLDYLARGVALGAMDAYTGRTFGQDKKLLSTAYESLGVMAERRNPMIAAVMVARAAGAIQFSTQPLARNPKAEIRSREMHVAYYMAHGWPVDVIARRLNCVIGTVSNDINAASGAVGVKKSLHLVISLFQSGIFELAGEVPTVHRYDSES